MQMYRNSYGGCTIYHPSVRRCEGKKKQSNNSSRYNRSETVQSNPSPLINAKEK